MSHLQKAGLMAVAVAAIMVASAATARADIILSAGNIPQADENVLLNTGMTGTTIFGTTNQTETSVRFMAVESITAPAMGQARIEAVDQGLTALQIDIPGLTFTSLILNIDAATNGFVGFNVTENNSQQTAGVFALGGSGENFFTITAINGQRISSVAFATDVGMTLTQVSDVAQIRIGGVATPTTSVPEPTTMLLLGTGLLGGAVRRWRQRHV